MTDFLVGRSHQIPSRLILEVGSYSTLSRIPNWNTESESSHLIIHDDLICHGVQKSGLVNEVLLCILVLLFACLLDIISGKSVQTGHLVFLMVPVVEISIDTCRLQQLHEVFRLSLFVILQLNKAKSYSNSLIDTYLSDNKMPSILWRGWANRHLPQVLSICAVACVPVSGYWWLRHLQEADRSRAR